MPFLAVFLLLLSLVAAHAQQQDSRMDQILNATPDHSLQNDFHKSFEGGKTADISKTFNAKAFLFDEHSFDKTFSTSEFAGAKKSAIGDRLFETKSATETTQKVIPNLDTKFATKKAEVKENSDSHKNFASKENDEAHRDYLGPESKKMHMKIDQNQDVGWQGKFDVMTVEQVRELLNKNK